MASAGGVGRRHIPQSSSYMPADACPSVHPSFTQCSQWLQSLPSVAPRGAASSPGPWENNNIDGTLERALALSSLLFLSVSACGQVDVAR